MSQLIERTYQDTTEALLKDTAELDNELREQEQLLENLEDTTIEPDDEGKTVGQVIMEVPGQIAEGASNIWDNVVGFFASVPETVNDAGELLRRYIEAFAVMLVTTCVMPLIAVFILLWAGRLILGIESERVLMVGQPRSPKE